MVLCAGSIATSAAATEGISVESATKALRQWEVAASKGDAAYLDRLFTPDYVELSWHEHVRERAEVIAATKKSKHAEPVARTLREFVQLLGDHASIHSLIEQPIDGRPQRILSTVDLVHRDGRWKAFYSQRTLVADTITDAKVLTEVPAATPAAQPTCALPEPGMDVGAYLIDMRHQWLAAEIRGDSAFLECLIAPNYNDVDSRGGSRPRQSLVDYSVQHADANKPIPPPVPQIATINGNSAVVRNLWSGKMGDKEVKVWLADTFVREGGRWRAIYSQQTLVRE
jgi:hypothetical protein